MKGLIIVASIIALGATLGACRKDVDHKPLKLGAVVATIAQ